jgi:nicotinamidase-related amidase
MSASDNVFDQLVTGLERTALVLIDFQADVCGQGGRMVSQDDAVLGRFRRCREVAGQLLAAARRHDMPRFHVTHVFQPGYPELNHDRLSSMQSYMIDKGAFLADSDGASIVPEVAPATGEVVLQKTSISPFETTDLTVRLRRAGVDGVLIAGVVTHYAVLAATIGATDRGYRATVVADACASGTPERHETALAILGPLADIWRDPWTE